MSLPDMSTPPRKRRRVVVIASIGGSLSVMAIIAASIVSGSAMNGSQEQSPATAPSSLGSASSTAAALPTVSAEAKAPTSSPGVSKPRPSPVAPTPRVSPSAVPLPPTDAKAVETNVKDFLAAGSKALESPPPTPSADDFKTLAIGSALDAMVANSEDFANNGWHQEGVPEVVSVTVRDYRPSAKPEQVTLDVCIDASKVNVLTADGTVVKNGSEADRSLNIVTLVKSKGNWLISNESFPDDPAC